MKITNEIKRKIKRKIMKAAWTTYIKRSNWKFSTFLKHAWKWGK